MPEHEKNEHSGHRERMRSRFLKSNFAEFTECEILEFLLYQIQPRCDTKQTAFHLLEKFGDLQSVFSADCEDLTTINGMGVSSAQYIVYLRKLFTAFQQYRLENFCLRSVESRQIYFMKRFEFELREVFMIACLDDRMRIVHSKILEKCEMESGLGEMMSMLVPLHCNQIIVAQNRLHGLMYFTEDDLDFARELKKQLEVLKMKMVDMILVCKGKAISLEADTRL